MKPPDEQQPDRRELLRTASRWLALGGIGLGSAALVTRAAGTRTDGGCPLAAGCYDCGALAGCRLRQAAIARGRKRR